MTDHDSRTRKIMTRINALAAFSEDGQVLTRTFGSAAFVKAGRQVSAWMEEAGLQTSTDNIGNIRGRLDSKLPGAKTFIIASHIDSVVNAGKFDGPLGVIMGLDLLENIARSALTIPFNIELIAFSDEEGVRFHSTFLGSKVVAGTFEKSLLEKKDASGITVKEVIGSMGGDAEKLWENAISPHQLAGYFEIHIEQGPVLYERKIPAAIVSSIAAQGRFELLFQGMSGHAGTVPMDMRRDALCAAAACILEIETQATNNKDTMVATVGKLEICNAASNVIPGAVSCSLDLRSADERVIEDMSGNLRLACEAICKKRNIDMEWKPVQFTRPVHCDEQMNRLLAASIEQCGYEVVHLVSGAGHDGVAMSEITTVAMMFVRCYRGISHNPLEHVKPGDITASLKIADAFLEKLISTYNQQ